MLTLRDMINTMNDLPTQYPPPVPATPTGNKEVVGGVELPEGLQSAAGQEMELPHEVVSAGVRIQPTSIPIPAPVAQMGVQPAGKNIPAVQTTTVVLPLTDDQIAKGLHESITSSWLWLAHWCIKRLKQFHVNIKTIRGKIIRVKI